MVNFGIVDLEKKIFLTVNRLRQTTNANATDDKSSHWTFRHSDFIIRTSSFIFKHTKKMTLPI